MHAGVGNKTLPERWDFVCSRFSKLARTFKKINPDLNILLYVHPKARTKDIFEKHIISSEVGDIDFEPDLVFTWNGNNDGDKVLRSKYSSVQFLYGELTLFDRHNTIFFDGKGIGVYSSLFSMDHQYDMNIDVDIIPKLQSKFKKPSACNEKFVFVPLQNPKDIIIKDHFESFDTMDDLVNFAAKTFPNHKVLYKDHPYFRHKTTIKNSRCVRTGADCHSLIPYADMVIGINSGVLVETLIYHSNVIACDNNTINEWSFSEEQRIQILNGFRKTMIPNTKLNDVEFIKRSYLTYFLPIGG